MLLMALAPYHRIVYVGEDTEDIYRIGSVLVTAATLPLGLGLAGGIYVVIAKIWGSSAAGLLASGLALLLLIGLWYLYPLVAATRPQQIASILLKPKHGQYIASNRLRRQAFETGRIRQDVEPNTGNTGNPVISDQDRRVHPDEPIDEAGAQQRGGEPSSALYEKPRDAAVAERSEGRIEVNIAIGGRIDIDHCDPAVAQLLSLLRDR
jgi:hypothetical protein